MITFFFLVQEIIGGDSITKAELAETFLFLDRHNIRPHIDRTFSLGEANEAQQVPSARVRAAPPRSLTVARRSWTGARIARCRCSSTDIPKGASCWI